MRFGTCRSSGWLVQIKMGFGFDFIVFVTFVISSAIITAWCYLDNGRSVLAVTLLNTIGNLSFDIFAYAPGTLKHLIYVSLMMLGAGAGAVLFYFQSTEKKKAP